MEYLVNIGLRAYRDLVELYREIDAQNSAAAREWYQGLNAAILSLATHPNRCPETPERRGLRHLLYGQKPRVYRVIFCVSERQKRVDVLLIRHGARRPLRGSTLGEAESEEDC
jgi:toxin ParE1/3/4